MWDRGSVQQVTPSAPCMGTSATCRWGAARQSRTSQQKPHGVKAGGALGRSDETAEDDEEARPRSSRPAPSSPALWEGQPARLCAGTRRGVPGSQGQGGRGGPGGKAATRVAFPDFAFPGVAPSHCSLESSRQKTVATSENGELQCALARALLACGSQCRRAASGALPSHTPDCVRPAPDRAVYKRDVKVPFISAPVPGDVPWLGGPTRTGRQQDETPSGLTLTGIGRETPRGLGSSHEAGVTQDAQGHPPAGTVGESAKEESKPQTLCTGFAQPRGKTRSRPLSSCCCPLAQGPHRVAHPGSHTREHCPPRLPTITAQRWGQSRGHILVTASICCSGHRSSGTHGVEARAGSMAAEQAMATRPFSCHPAPGDCVFPQITGCYCFS